MASNLSTDRENLKDLVRLLDEERERHNQQMDLIKRKILIEAGMIKTPDAPTVFTDFKGKKRMIKYRELKRAAPRPRPWPFLKGAGLFGCMPHQAHFKDWGPHANNKKEKTA